MQDYEFIAEYNENNAIFFGVLCAESQDEATIKALQLARSHYVELTLRHLSVRKKEQ